MSYLDQVSILIGVVLGALALVSSLIAFIRFQLGLKSSIKDIFNRLQGLDREDEENARHRKRYWELVEDLKNKIQKNREDIIELRGELRAEKDHIKDLKRTGRFKLDLPENT